VGVLPDSQDHFRNMATGPSFAGPLTGWTAATVAPVKTLATVPTSEFRPQPQGSAAQPTPFDYRSFEQAEAGPDYDNSPAANLARLDRAKKAEEFARASGDPYQLQLAQQMLVGFTMQATPGDAAAKRAAGAAAEQAFVQRNPGTQARLNATPPSLRELVLGRGTPSAAVSTTVSGGGTRSGGGSSSDDSSDSLGPDPRVAQKPRTPLESLLAAIYPEAATPPAPDPFADPRAVTPQTSVIDTILGNLGANRGAGSGYVSGPAFNGPAYSASPATSNGAAIASTIPGAPPFLAPAIDNVQAFNPFAQAPARPVATGGGGFDPLVGISAIAAEQRIQKAQLDAAKAKAQADYHASQVKQEKMRSEATNLNRLKGFGASGWSGPALPTY